MVLNQWINGNYCMYQLSGNICNGQGRVILMWRPGKKNKRRGSPEAIKRGIVCPFRMPRDEHFGIKFQIRKASPYGSARNQRWKCTVCKKTFSETKLDGRGYRKRKIGESQRARFLWGKRWTIRDIAFALKVSKTSVVKWLKNP